ncbi:unnamed protein product [Closterium sp. NIES-53]
MGRLCAGGGWVLCGEESVWAFAGKVYRFGRECTGGRDGTWYDAWQLCEGLHVVLEEEEEQQLEGHPPLLASPYSFHAAQLPVMPLAWLQGGGAARHVQGHPRACGVAQCRVAAHMLCAGCSAVLASQDLLRAEEGPLMRDS